MQKVHQLLCATTDSLTVQRLAHPNHSDNCRRAPHSEGEGKKQLKIHATILRKKYNHMILHFNYTHHFQSPYFPHQSQMLAVLPALCHLPALTVIGGGSNCHPHFTDKESEAWGTS